MSHTCLGDHHTTDSFDATGTLMWHNNCALCELSVLRTKIEQLRTEIEWHRKAQAKVYLALDVDEPDRDKWPDIIKKLKEEKGTCGVHASKGSPGKCLACSVETLNSAISRIDYICGEPNDMGVSGYDVHCDEENVVKAVRKLRDDKEMWKARAEFMGWGEIDAAWGDE